MARSIEIGPAEHNKITKLHADAEKSVKREEKPAEQEKPAHKEKHEKKDK